VSWTTGGVGAKAGATHLPLPSLMHAFLNAGLTPERLAEGRRAHPRHAGHPHNGTVGYQNCLNALAGSAACMVTAWLIVVSSWSVRSSRLLART